VSNVFGCVVVWEKCTSNVFISVNFFVSECVFVCACLHMKSLNACIHIHVYEKFVCEN
jgi:hypothetical protein